CAAAFCGSALGFDVALPHTISYAEAEDLDMSVYKAAVAQLASCPFDTAAATQRALTAMREAAAAGARLMVFPEAFLGGYPKGATFGAPVGLRKPEGRDAFRRYYEAAIEVPGTETARIAEAAAET